MVDQGDCEICKNPAEYEFVPPRVTWRCPRCGEFCYDNSEGPPRIRSPDEMVRLSGWVREQNAAGEIPVRITPETARRVAQRRPPGLRERANVESKSSTGAVCRQRPRRGRRGAVPRGARLSWYPRLAPVSSFIVHRSSFISGG